MTGIIKCDLPETKPAMLKTVVCDDELPALDLMSSLLEETGEVSIAAACQSVREAIDIINRGGVDLVVFDIEMPELSGVDAYAEITVQPRPLVFFATAHPEYALDAFGVDAIDYVLKPFDFERVKRAVDKAVRLKRLIVEREKGAPISAPETPDPDQIGLLKIKDAGKSYFMPHKDIIWVEAAGDYSVLHVPGREITVRIPLKTLEEGLPGPLFVRIHRSAIISTAHIREITHLPKGEAQILLSEQASVRASRSYRAVVERLTGAA